MSGPAATAENRRRPLFGKRVLVLRAAEQSTPLIEALDAAGADTLHVPLLQFEAVETERALDFDEFDWVAFTSANAVRFTAPLASGRARVACIGPATAKAARGVGMRVDAEPSGASLPETLAAAIHACDSLVGKRVLVPRVEGAREAFPEALRKLGATVETREVYRNHVPTGAFERLRKIAADGVDAALVTSPSSVTRLIEALGRDRFLRLAEETVMVCIGPTTTQALREAGAGDVVIAADAQSDALIRALEEHYSEA